MPTGRSDAHHNDRRQIKAAREAAYRTDSHVAEVSCETGGWTDLRFSCTGGMQNFCLPAAACASDAPNASNSANAGSYKFHQLLSRREQ